MHGRDKLWPFSQSRAKKEEIPESGLVSKNNLQHVLCTANKTCTNFISNMSYLKMARVLCFGSTGWDWPSTGRFGFRAHTPVIN